MMGYLVTITPKGAPKVDLLVYDLERNRFTSIATIKYRKIFKEARVVHNCMVRSFIVSGVKDRKYLDGVLNLLVEILNIRASYFKPRFWGDYQVTINGPDEDRAFRLFAIFASTVGWRIE